MTHEWPAVLTRREAEIATLICAGLTRFAVMALMRISYKTYDSHRGAVFRKLGLDPRAEAQLLRYALARGIVDPPAVIDFNPLTGAELADDSEVAA